MTALSEFRRVREQLLDLQIALDVKTRNGQKQSYSLNIYACAQC